MTSVERCELRLVQSFHDCQDRCINITDLGVCVSIGNLPDSMEVFGKKRFDAVGPGKDVVEQGDQDSGLQPGVDPIIDCDQDRLRDNERLGG